MAEVRKRVEAAERRAAEEAAVEEARLERIRLKREARLEEEQATREAQLQREASIRGDLQAAYRKKGLGAAGGSGTSLLAQIRQRNAAAIAWTPSAAAAPSRLRQEGRRRRRRSRRRRRPMLPRNERDRSALGSGRMCMYF